MGTYRKYLNKYFKIFASRYVINYTISRHLFCISYVISLGYIYLPKFINNKFSLMYKCTISYTIYYGNIFILLISKRSDFKSSSLLTFRVFSSIYIFYSIRFQLFLNKLTQTRTFIICFRKYHLICPDTQEVIH